MSGLKSYYDLEERQSQNQKDFQTVLRLCTAYSENITLSDLLSLLEKEIQASMEKMKAAEKENEHISSRNLRAVIFDMMKENNVTYSELSSQIGCTSCEIEQTIKGEQPNDCHTIFLKLCERFDIPKKRFIHYLLPSGICMPLKRIEQ